jgi:thermitase
MSITELRYAEWMGLMAIRTLSRPGKFINCALISGALIVALLLVSGCSGVSISIGTQVPAVSTLPPEEAAVPTAVPPATVPPAPPPVTPVDCAMAAQAVQEGNNNRANNGRGNGQQRNLPPGQERHGNQQEAGGRVRNRVIIHFVESSTRQERAEYIRSIAGNGRRNIDKLSTVVVNLPADTDPSALPPSPIVEFIESDYTVAAVAAEPNDAHYVDQWALPAINAPAAWAALPANTPFVTVAVIDSGVCLNHPDLAGKIVAGWDFVQDDDQAQDEFGHGCGVAGIIAANANNGTGIAGVAPNARVMPLRVLDGLGMGSVSDVAAAIIYAADSGAQVMNLSLAGPSTSTILEEAVNYAVARGVIIIASAGNQGVEAAWYPAAYPAVIAVGSVDQSLQRSSFSNYGAQIDVMAPGRDIYTTEMNGDYITMTGTSFAAPQVAGAAALMMAFGQPLVQGGALLSLNPPMPAC